MKLDYIKLAKEFMKERNLKVDGKTLYDDCGDFAMHLLSNYLPKKLYFHDLAHTYDVLNSGIILINNETRLGNFNASERDINNLLTSKKYHDIGYIEQHGKNEPIAIDIAASVLPLFGYGDNDVDQISGIILATQMPQQPKNHLEEIICDADLDNFGRDDFFKKTRLLREEFSANGIEIPEKKWYENTLKLLEGHKYFTQSARTLRDGKKADNIRILKELVTYDTDRLNLLISSLK